MEKYLSATPQATILFSILTMAFFINALIYLFRLICSLIWGEKKAQKYGSLWMLPYGLLLLLGIHPPHTFSYPMLRICLILWIFALICAIIQSKALSRLTWRKWGAEMTMQIIQGVICACGKMRKGLEWLRKKWESLTPFIRTIITALSVGMLVVAALWVPDMSVPFAIPWLLGILLIRLWLAMSSCRELLKVWFVESILFALMVASAAGNLLPNEIANQFVAYAVFSVIYTLTWCITAGMADYDVAKMACGVVNTVTTIGLLFVNIFPYWCSENADILVPCLNKVNPQLTEQIRTFTAEDFVYAFNLILFPLVVAGFIAALFAEGQQYLLKREKHSQ